MKTLLSRFCEEFESAVRPLLEPLSSAAGVLDGVSEGLAVRGLLPSVRDVEHRLRALSDKVADQQAYLLIFGPLKSGKSTLMNAVAGGYVSEVTTLPAYPCMVYVRHAPDRKFTITRYDGTREPLPDAADRQAILERAHIELADRLREVENEGESFDPAVHLPSAIRRVDVGIPAPELAQSSAVLVDTPGLYSRMRFGYDLMTREFRDSAACAVFVVKTDNLFLEQVFDEFEDLLALFSRIFLVVNLDSDKKDLKPDGHLSASLEREDPGRIIEAFRNLAMGAPLRKAVEEGRLRIFPVDLLRAAARRLRGPGEPGEPEPEDAFDAFLRDLTEYLNSADYLEAFLGDSLRQADGLLSVLEGLLRAEPREALSREIAAQREVLSRSETAARALDTLEAVHWEEVFSGRYGELVAAARGKVEALSGRVEEELSASLEQWFESDASFAGLRDHFVGPVLQKAGDELAGAARGVFADMAGSDTAGADLDGAARQAMGTLDLRLGPLGERALERVDLERSVRAEPLSLAPTGVPIRKGLLDWILFRSRSQIRRRLFGPDRAPERPVPPRVKSRKLGDAGRRALGNAVSEASRVWFEGAVRRLTADALDPYAVGVQEGVRETLVARRERNEEIRRTAASSLEELTRVEASMDALGAATAGTRERMTSLADRHADTDPELLGRPVEDAAGETGRPPETPDWITTTPKAE